MRLGTDNISKIYLGSDEITKAYLGADQVYSSFDPEAGLTLTESITATNNFGTMGATRRGQNAVFACETKFPTSAVDGVLFEYGGSGVGAYVGTRDASGTRKLRLRAGNGSSASTSGTDVVILDYSNYPLDNVTRTLVWEIRVDPGRVRFWIDGVLIGVSNTTGGGPLKNSVWAGPNNGGYGSTDTSVPTNEPSSSWGGTIVSSLRYYANQLVST